MEGYGAKTVKKLIGVTYRQLAYWDKTGLAKPSVQEATGTGSRRLYSFQDLIQMKVTKALMTEGISVQKIRKCLAYLRKHMPEVERPLAQLRFLTDGETIFVLTRDKKQMIDTLHNGQLVLSLAIDQLVNDLEGRLKEFTKKRKATVTVGEFQYTVVLEPDQEEGGFVVYCPELPGCASQGETEDEALEMIQDAIEGCLGILKEREKTRGRRAS